MRPSGTRAREAGWRQGHCTRMRTRWLIFRGLGVCACDVIVHTRLASAATGSGAGKQLPGRQLQSLLPRQPGQAGPGSAGRKRSGSIFAPGSLLGTGVPKKLPGTKKLPANPAGPGTAEPGAPGGALAAERRGQAGTAAVEGRVPRQDHAVHRAAPTPRGGPQNKPAGSKSGSKGTMTP
jgi:hypothetical protein